MEVMPDEYGNELQLQGDWGTPVNSHSPTSQPQRTQETKDSKTEEQLDLDNQEWQQALQIIQYTRRSLFLTGKAGTGKSTFLRYVSQHTKKKHVILAPTGIAAINAGGQTLHSFFKLPFHPLLPNDTRYNAATHPQDTEISSGDHPSCCASWN